jgi:hypothetical protein
LGSSEKYRGIWKKILPVFAEEIHGGVRIRNNDVYGAISILPFYVIT